MQKIIIQNFGAVKSAEIEVKKFLVLIGEQASGKSTVAKFIYFFKSLKDDLFNQLYNSEQVDFELAKDLLFPIREKFYNFFGSTFHLPDFTIRYYYDVANDRYVELSLNTERKLQPRFSDNMLTIEKKKMFANFKKLLNASHLTTVLEQLAADKNRINHAKRLSSFIDDFFNNQHADSLYAIAGRSSTVSYSELFEKYLFLTVKNSVEENRKTSFVRKQNTIDESLMLEFMERVTKLKETFMKFDGFEGLIETYASDENKEQLNEIKSRIDEIIRGKYTIDSFGEKITFDEYGGYTTLKNASSGQQEVIRILQDIFISILDNNAIFRIIEEPEAHLFPIAQKQLIELFSLLINYNETNQIVITTHSPYILSVFNNLLFANRVNAKNQTITKEIKNIIPSTYWIDSSDFAAYSLKSSLDESHYCISIVDHKTQLINQNYLDEVSEMLGGEFNALYSLHSKSFARR